MKSNKWNLKPIWLMLIALPAWADNVQDLPNTTVSGKRLPISGSQLDSGSKATLDAATLQTTRAPSLGQTLERISGVHNSSFGANNGLPQIRSLTGSRVYISENGLGIADMAAMSGNMPTAVEPFLADKISVQKSSAAVLYGGNAVGGAVTVETGLIPNQLPEQPIGGKVEISGGYNTPHSELFRLDGTAGNVAWHIDGANSQISGYKIPSYNKMAACRDGTAIMGDHSLELSCQAFPQYEEFFNKAHFAYVDNRYLQKGKDFLDDWGLGLGDVYKEKKPNWFDNSMWIKNPLYDPNETEGYGKRLTELIQKSPDVKGKMPNSHAHRQSASAGISYIGERGYIGMGISRYRHVYGVPGYVATLSSAGDELRTAPVNIDTTQTRWQIDAQYHPATPWLDNIRAQFAYTNAQNKELLGEHLANSLNSHIRQARLEANIHPTDWWKGTLGLDWRNRSTNGQGKDRYLPNTRTQEYGLFALQKFSAGQWSGDIGARYGKVHQQAFLQDYTPSRGLTEGYIKQHNNKTFQLRSYQANLTWQPALFWQTGIRWTHSQRAPDVNELFASNRHHAILANEHGDPRLKPETAKTWEWHNQFNIGNSQINVNHYQTQFHDYLYLGSSGTTKDGHMPYKEWRQGDTKISGWEVDWQHQFDLASYGKLQTRVFADWVKNRAVSCGSDNPAHADFGKYVRCKNDGAYMPKLPTTRYGVGLTWQKNAWNIATSLTHYRPQKHLGRNVNPEPDLGGYTLWDLYASYTHHIAQSELEWFVDARNLSNTEARPHNSTLKYLTPLAGRSVRVGLKISF
ncbi:Probable TonB-dependent receptor NMB0964 precursor [Kingella kingae]|uniref:TonB-dependent receptor n=1 Tax=Kingella kingae TaxID=504 RepID=UPI000408A616|nr:TonB-dependent receptor [Kingella kingae]MDK4578131.1 TonB-dependent receptor [Kingella kingae]MDK4673763.1 TonB-dependent receptor [Kingella kingae]QIP47962.1 TonB-dependent receptor [Kingella kingae]STR02198.1 Probable TonB-dependent receptor NMB0964 precursor [Kingella kingae]